MEERKKPKVDTSISKLVLEKYFLNANKEVTKLPFLKPSQLGKYLYSKGFKMEGKKLYKECLDGKTFILLMTSIEGIKILQEELEFSKESVEGLKKLYKSIYLFRKKFCFNLESNEEPFY